MGDSGGSFSVIIVIVVLLGCCSGILLFQSPTLDS